MEVGDVPKVTVPGVCVQVIPEGNESVSVTVPVDPVPATTVIVEVPETPTRTVEETGLAVTLKANTISVTFIATEGTPALVPLTLTV
jgi:hypothetical protein